MGSWLPIVARCLGAHKPRPRGLPAETPPVYLPRASPTRARPMRIRSLRRTLALVTCTVTLSSCFSYFPATLDTVPAGDGLRVYVTPAGLAEVSELPVATGPILQGTLVRREGDGILMHIPLASREEGFYRTAIGQDVRIATRDILQVERRQINRWATGLLIAGTAFTAATVLTLSVKAFDGTSRVPPDEDQMRLPIFWLPIR